MSKKFNRKIVAMVMATSMGAAAIPVQVIGQGKDNNNTNIKIEPSLVTTGSMIQVTTESAIQIIPVAEIEGNIINNFSFEETSASKEGQWASDLGATGWKASPWGTGKTMPEVILDETEKNSGNYSVKLKATDANTRGWIEQSVAVEPDTTYILEGYIKTQGVQAGYFGVQVLQYAKGSNTALTTDVNQTLHIQTKKETEDWTYYKAEFKTGDNVTRINVRPYLGTRNVAKEGGMAWIDDLAITKKPHVALTGLSLPEKARVAVGDMVTLKPVFAPVDATNQKVTWVSEDETVATVSASGMVKGIGEGTVTIKAVSEEGNLEASTTLTVEKGMAVNLADNGSFEETVKTTNKYWKDGIAPKNWQNLWTPTVGEGLMLGIDQTEYSHGLQSVHVKAPKQSRVCFNTVVPLDPTKTYRLSMNMKLNNVVGGGVYFRVQYLDQNDKKTQDAVPGISAVKGTKDWDNYELVLKGIPANTVKMKIEVFFENATGEAWFDDARLVETYDFSLNQSTAKVLAGETIQLEPIFGIEVPNKKVEWVSSNEAVATVDENGLVTTIVPGAATITATTIDGNRATCSISVEDPALMPVYKELRQNWSDRMTINDIVDKNNPDYVANMKALAEDATKLWESMNKYDEAAGTDTRVALWDNLNSTTVSAQLTSMMANLRTMARAYASEGCSLYKNPELGKDILAALDWFYANRYNEEIKMYNNWWDWDIGVPQKLNDVLVLMYDELSKEQLDDHLRAINRFVPTPTTVPGGPNPLTGANLLDTAMVSAVSGMLEESNRRLVEARDSVSEVLPYVTKGDGFYEDGSFIQHTDFPYAGGYGGVLMSGIANLLFITDSTPWEVTDSQIGNVYDWIINGFEPVYYKGAIMDMVSGRGISRYNSSDHNKGKGLLPKMLALAETAPEPKKTQIKAFVKENVMADSVCEEGYFEKMNINDVLAFKALLADESIPARGDLALHKVYGAMDRTVHHRPGFTLGISMHSSRIAAYEVGNGENKKAWHTADGMLYLYNDDLNQFGDNFWPTVDPMRLPGITTDHSERTNKDWAHNTSSKDWVGGSSLRDVYGATGMEFEMEKGKSTLTGKKSWFMFDDEIVALGAGINASDDKEVETIFENRKIKDSGDNTVIVDGKEMLENSGEVNVEGANWAFLGGNTEAGTDTIGYYFPGTTNLKAIKETRTASWNDINDGGPTTQVSKNYVSFATSHGTNPKDADYSYVLLPNKTADEVAAYSEKADITVVKNTKEVQAVRENRLGVMGINFWAPSSVEYVTAKNPSSVMIEEGKGTLSLGISDPTHKAKEVTIVLDKADYKVVSKDNTVTVREIGDQIEITVKTEKSMGKTHQVELVSKNPVEISLDKTQISLRKGRSETLKVSVLPEAAGLENLVWTSSDERVAEVISHQDGTATVNALKKGVAEIKVATEDGKVSATCRVTVRNNDNGEGSQNPDHEVGNKPEDKDKEIIEKEPVEEVQNVTFKDVKEGHWAYETITKAAALGIIEGYPNGTFKPSDKLSVEETFTFLNRLLVMSGVTHTSLAPEFVEKYVSNKEHWAYEHMFAVASKLTEETLEEVMNAKYITRELLAQIIYEINGSKKVEAKETKFTDLKDSKYQEALLYCVEEGLMNGVSEEVIAPGKVLTRAELMTILIRLDEKLDLK